MMYDGTIVVPVTLAPLSCCTAIGVLAASHRTPSKPKSRLPIYKYWYRSEKLLQQLIITRFLFICINILIHGSRDRSEVPVDWNKTQNTEQLLVPGTVHQQLNDLTPSSTSRHGVLRTLNHHHAQYGTIIQHVGRPQIKIYDPERMRYP